MTYATLIDCQTLAGKLQQDWRIIDCRFDLANPQAGRSAWQEAHIPGALYAHVDSDLSSEPVTDHGRHPLPDAQTLCQRFSALGIGNDTQVVVYDNASGAFAARLWWMLRYLGHTRVAVLDGGWQAWNQARLPVSEVAEVADKAEFSGQAQPELLVTLAQVPKQRLLIDARDAARYQGQSEPIDRVPGHIPGAINRFWKDNLDEQGHFRPSAQLLADFTRLLRDCPAQQAVCYCGSGVTACHNVLAMVHAGLPQPRLYVGSWSEWCSDPARPVAVGKEP